MPWWVNTFKNVPGLRAGRPWVEQGNQVQHKDTLFPACDFSQNLDSWSLWFSLHRAVLARNMNVPEAKVQVSKFEKAWGRAVHLEHASIPDQPSWVFFSRCKFSVILMMAGPAFITESWRNYRPPSVSCPFLEGKWYLVESENQGKLTLLILCVQSPYAARILCAKPICSWFSVCKAQIFKQHGFCNHIHVDYIPTGEVIDIYPILPV